MSMGATAERGAARPAHSRLGRRLVTLTLGLACVASLCRCAYSTRRLAELPAGVRTVAVKTLVNDGFRRDLELRLTQAVLDEVRARTSYGIASPSSADVVISGSVTADESVITQGANGNALQQRLAGTLTVILTERRTGRVLKTYAVYANTEFTPDRRGQTLEGSAADEWARRLAEQVVRGFEAGF